MLVTLLILIPILFVVGTVVSALNEQRKLENGLLRKIIAQRAKEREEHLKKMSKNKESAASAIPPSNSLNLLSFMCFLICFNINIIVYFSFADISFYTVDFLLFL